MKGSTAINWRRCPKGAQVAQRSKQGILGIFGKFEGVFDGSKIGFMRTSLFCLCIAPSYQLGHIKDRAAAG